MSTTFIAHSAASLILENAVAVEAAIDRGASADHCYPDVAAAMNGALEQLASSGIWGPENRIPSAEFWSIAGKVLGRGWLQHRARSKPRGYAGDYELLARIIRRELCEDSLGRLYDRYFQEQAAPQAVRNRTELVRQWVVDLVRNGAGGSRVVAVVGCGPALDMVQAVADLSADDRSRLQVRLLDLDPQAIGEAEVSLRPFLPEGQLESAADNLFRLPRKPALLSMLDGADLIVCTGLFDYFDEPTAATMLRTSWQRLAPGGRCVVFNFAPHNPSRAFMEWVGNWYLIYRDEAAMLEMAEAAAIPKHCVAIGAEPLGIDLFVEAKRD